MLAKENRLQKDRDFQKVFKGSRPIHTQNLVLRVAKQNLRTEEPKNQRTRFGFVISNKISKLATRRNALKRQLRTIIQDRLGDIKLGYDVVILVKSDFSYPYRQGEIKKQVEEGLGKAGLIK